MKLGIITTMAGAPWGGSEELWLALAQKAMADNSMVSVSVYDWGGSLPQLQDLVKKGAIVNSRSRLSYNDIKGKAIGKFNQLFFAERQLSSFVKQEKPEVLLINMGAFCDLEIDPFRNFLLNCNIPYCLIVHVNTESYVFNFTKLREVREVCSKARRVFFVSNRLKEQAERQIAFHFHNSEIIINPVGLKNISIVPFTDENILRMACVGRIEVDVKGQSLLLQILSSEKWKSRNWELNIYGKGRDENLVKELIRFYGLDEKVFIRGHVNDIRNDVWAKNHILLMPSFAEGMPIVLIEAMLCGRTSVVSDVGGAREIIEEGISGFIAEAAVPYSYEKALEKAWQNKTKLKEIGNRAFEITKKFYGTDPVGYLWETIKEMK